MTCYHCTSLSKKNQIDYTKWRKPGKVTKGEEKDLVLKLVKKKGAKTCCSFWKSHARVILKRDRVSHIIV